MTLDPQEGYVDLVDFARGLRDSSNGAIPAAVRSAAAGVVTAASESTAPTVVKVRSLNGEFNGQTWNFAGANGLSI